jgi:hypothetical protein
VACQEKERQTQATEGEAMNDDFLVGALSMLHYIYHTSADKFADDIFRDSFADYKLEKIKMWTQSPARAISMLDNTNLKKLIQIASDRHHVAASDLASFLR